MASYKDILNKKAKEWGCPDMMNSVKDFIPKIPLSSPLLNWLTYGGIPRGRIVEFHGEEGGGKAQPLYSKVLTPDGFVEMGDIQIGDTVFDRNGNRCTVDGIFPQEVQEIYEITLQDRTTIRVAKNHLNIVWRWNYYKKCREEAVFTTEELIDAFHNDGKCARNSSWRVDVPSVTWEEQPVPIDPYLLGALIGDGGTSREDGFGFTNGEADVIHKVDSILRRDWGCYLKQSSSSEYDWDIFNCEKWYPLRIEFNDKSFNSFREFRDYLSEIGYNKFDPVTLYKLSNGESSKVGNDHPELYGVKIIHNAPSGRHRLYETIQSLHLDCKSKDKHIPVEYLHNSKHVRLELLRGLFDTDGYSDAEGGTNWTTSSSRLSTDFAFLVRSLGIRDTVVEEHPHFNGKEFIAWTHYLKVPNSIKIASSVKHLNRWRPSQWEPFNRIDSIELVGQDRCQCLHVTSPDHTYISDNFIPTHNTSSAIDLSYHAKIDFEKEHEEKVQLYRDYVAKGKKEYAGPLEDLIDDGPKKVVYWDLEHTFDWAWAGKLGLMKGDIDVAQPGNVGGEDICQAIEDIARTGQVGLIIVDSIPSLVTKAEWEKKYGERTVSSLAGLMTTFMRKMAYVCSENDCTLLLINQTRDNMDNPYVIQTPGGRAIKFYSTTRMYFRKGAPLDFAGNELPMNTENPSGYKINVKLVKQKGAAFDRKVASYYLMSQSGIRPDFDYAKLAVDKYNIILKKGGWFTMCDPTTGEILCNDQGNPIKVQGMLKVYDYLRDNPNYYELIKSFINKDINGEDADMDDVIPTDIEYHYDDNEPAED